MSITGASGADGIYARLEAVEGSGPGWLSAIDSDSGLRNAIADLGRGATIGGSQVEALVREAKDWGEISTSEKQALVNLLQGRSADFEPGARIALARFLGVADPGGRPEPAAARASQPAADSGRAGVLSGLSVANDPTIPIEIRSEPELVAVLTGRGTLGPGTSGEGARALQRALAEVGLGEGGVDGHYGPGTAESIEALQRRAGLPATGRADAATIKALGDALVAAERQSFDGLPVLGRVRDGEHTLGRGADGAAVREVQRALLDCGFDLGRAGADGDYGGQTAQAVRTVQQRLGLPATGTVDARTLAAIGRLAGTDHRTDLGAPLIGSNVGPGERNHPGDVAAVQERLKTLGFYDGPVNGRFNNKLNWSLRLFDATSTAAETMPRRGTALANARTLVPGEGQERWLRADNAPRWQRVPASGPGWVNGDRDRHSAAASWLVASLERVGTRYEASRTDHPGWTPIRTNDASRTHGGDTPDHETHEAGLDLDLVLGDGGLSYRSNAYDRDETWAKICAFLDDPSVEDVYFNDPQLIARANRDPAYAGRVKHVSGHDDHFHVNFEAPARKDPS